MGDCFLMDEVKSWNDLIIVDLRTNLAFALAFLYSTLNSRV